MRSVLSITFTLLCLAGFTQFDTYFEDKTLRLDYYHSGTDTEEFYSIDELLEEPHWGGSKTKLVDEFDYGNYKFEVYDSASNKLIYSRGYSTLFGEWQTTAEAKQTRRSFSETIIFPYPKNSVIVTFYGRDRYNNWVKNFEYKIHPSSYFIKPERRKEYPNFEVHNSGDPAQRVDIVFIPEGYTAEEKEKFHEDCERYAGYLFGCQPYDENKDKINIWGVEAPSEEPGTDIPGEDVWKKTQVNSNFYTFDLPHYLTTLDNKGVRDLAANAHYDQIYILVNTDKYGGGGLYNYYSVTSVDHLVSDFVFVHELGHAFAGLGDEYFTSDVAYENFYPLDVEPWEPNLTTLVNFNMKWKNMVNDTVPVPTPTSEHYQHVVGAYEGGGYEANGVYRPFPDCTMKSGKFDHFCPVCRRAIQRMIDYYAE